jgi:hypothetical protein
LPAAASGALLAEHDVLRMGNSLSAACLVAALGLALALASPVLAQVPTLPQAKETLKASLDEWRREDAAYRSARGAARISARESEEYAGYVAGLRLRVLEQCEVVRGLGGEEAIKDFDCLRGAGEPRRAAAAVPPATVLTDEEKKAALHARLDALEGDIDDNLQKRQQEIRQTSTGTGRSTGAGGGAAGSGAGGSGGAAGGSSSTSGSGTAKETGKDAGKGTWTNPEAAGSSDKKEDSASAGKSGQPSSSSGDNATNRQGAGGRQTVRDGGSDDDVVARQLREAAEKETDPVLKEKLWAEYRKYKEGKK